MGNIRIVIDNGDQTGLAVCLCGREFNWNIPLRVNVLYKIAKDQQLHNVLCCPKCLAMLQN